MLPPVRPNVLSRSTGVRIWRAITEDLNPGAYCSTISKQRSAYSLRKSSVQPPVGAYGAYCGNIGVRCLPGGATVGAGDDGIVHSRAGAGEMFPYLASS